MPFFRRAIVALAMLPALTAPLHAQTSTNADSTCPPATADERVTLAFDAVELVKGNGEVEGSRTLWAAHGKYTYLFKDAANLAAFKADPAKYEIQWNGACGRMGPLSGAGSTKLPVVHEGKLYLCASPKCRETFRKDAARLIEKDDPRPEVDAASRERALMLLDRAAAAIGKDSAVDSIVTYREVSESTAESKGKTIAISKTRTLAFPGRMTERDTWDTYAWGTTVAGADAFQFGSAGAEDLAPAQRRAFERYCGQSWLAALRERKSADSVIAPAGEDTVDGVRVQFATVWHDGVSITLGISADGRVVCSRYRGRDESLFIADIEERFSDYREAGPLTVPFATRVFADGVEQKSLAWRFSRVDVNPILPPETFDRPAAPK
ncbi:MAG TPA: hypothetical protein VHN77_08925 [Phycisphaerales bacterium]|nr:hypothetical protein [Phycisphaerales bacterium]